MNDSESAVGPGSTPEPALIHAKDVQLHYSMATGQAPILDHLNFQLPSGQQMALLGRSGSGKTTLLHACAGLLPISSGSLTVCDQPLHQMNETARTAFRRQHIGLIFQQFNLIPTLTVLENLQFVCAMNRQTIDESELLALLESLDIVNKQARFPAQLSGGEQQRVAVARALAHKPALVLADEPTGNLDMDNARLVIDLLVSACRQRGAGLVLVTHSSELPSGLDSVARLEQGRLVFE